MYGNKESKKIIVGNNAKKNRKASDDARVVSELFCNPINKKTNTSKSGIPSKPGKTNLFE